MRKSHAVYIHIPFCNTICSYCDFPKVYYSESLADDYLKKLKQEIINNYKGEKISTFYIGGGTPSALNINQLTKLFEMINLFKTEETLELTFEANPESLTEEKVKILVLNKVNRISLGVQSFNKGIIKYLNRNHNIKQVKTVVELLKKNNIKNISVDLIYGVKSQTLKELQEDLDEYLALNLNHISTYSLIIEPNTVLQINKQKNIEENLENDMYNLIKKTLKEKGYCQYEISNYAKPGFESRHNLVYWNNKDYYGFGLGASGFLNNVRYYNTKSITEYLKGKLAKKEEFLTKNENIENYLMLGLRQIKGININELNNLYNIDILKNKRIKEEIKRGRLIMVEDYLHINEKYMYTMNEILVNLIGELYE